ncbi:hypothetical protein F4825DRAFT_444514 [Nemania diffusa]|nr:hypothetical protein F4825DRAFT_444514 [Nemania diffusa]
MLHPISRARAMPRLVPIIHLLCCLTWPTPPRHHHHHPHHHHHHRLHYYLLSIPFASSGLQTLILAFGLTTAARIYLSLGLSALEYIIIIRLGHIFCIELLPKIIYFFPPLTTSCRPGCSITPRI